MGFELIEDHRSTTNLGELEFRALTSVAFFSLPHGGAIDGRLIRRCANLILVLLREMSTKLRTHSQYLIVLLQLLSSGLRIYNDIYKKILDGILLLIARLYYKVAASTPTEYKKIVRLKVKIENKWRQVSSDQAGERTQFPQNYSNKGDDWDWECVSIRIHWLPSKPGCQHWEARFHQLHELSAWHFESVREETTNWITWAVLSSAILDSFKMLWAKRPSPQEKYSNECDLDSASVCGTISNGLISPGELENSNRNDIESDCDLRPPNCSEMESVWRAYKWDHDVAFQWHWEVSGILLSLWEATEDLEGGEYWLLLKHNRTSGTSSEEHWLKKGERNKRASQGRSPEHPTEFPRGEGELDPSGVPSVLQESDKN